MLRASISLSIQTAAHKNMRPTFLGDPFRTLLVETLSAAQVSTLTSTALVVGPLSRSSPFLHWSKVLLSQEAGLHMKQLQFC